MMQFAAYVSHEKGHTHNILDQLFGVVAGRFSSHRSSVWATRVLLFI